MKLAAELYGRWQDRGLSDWEIRRRLAAQVLETSLVLGTLQLHYYKFPNTGAVRSDREWLCLYLKSRGQELSIDIWQHIFCSIYACYISLECSWTELTESKMKWGCAPFGEFTVLPPVSAVEVIELVPAVCLSVRPSGFESYIVHHLMGAGLRCAPPTCAVHHGAQGRPNFLRSVCQSFIPPGPLGKRTVHGGSSRCMNAQAFSFIW